MSPLSLFLSPPQPALNWESNPNGGKAWFVAKGRPDPGPPYRGGNLFYRALKWSSTNAVWASSGWQSLPIGSDPDYLKYYDFDSAGSLGIDFHPPQKDTDTDFTLTGVGSRFLTIFIQDEPASDSELLWMCHQVGLAGTELLYGDDEFTGTRWGDYSTTSLDPTETTFWTVQEYAEFDQNLTGFVWDTWISEIEENP